MPKTLAKGTTRVDFLAAKPASLVAPTTTELNGAVALSCAIVADGFTLAFTDSDTVSQPALCETTNTKALDASNAEAKFTVFRYYDTDGKIATAEDTAFAAIGTRGTAGYLVRRDGKPSGGAWASGDVGWIFPVIADNPQHVSDTSGYQRMTIPFVVTGDPVKFTVAT